MDNSFPKYQFSKMSSDRNVQAVARSDSEEEIDNLIEWVEKIVPDKSIEEENIEQAKAFNIEIQYPEPVKCNQCLSKEFSYREGISKKTKKVWKAWVCSNNHFNWIQT